MKLFDGTYPLLGKALKLFDGTYPLLGKALKLFDGITLRLPFILKLFEGAFFYPFFNLKSSLFICILYSYGSTLTTLLDGNLLS